MRFYIDGHELDVADPKFFIDEDLPNISNVTEFDSNTNVFLTGEEVAPITRLSHSQVIEEMMGDYA